MTSLVRSEKFGASIVWFRKCLRIHDNPALLEACSHSKKVYPLFIIDPYFAKPHIVDLDRSLRSLGSRLYVVRGKPEEKLIELVEQWNIDLLTFETDTEPYARRRDELVRSQLETTLRISQHVSHTLFHPNLYLSKAKGNISTSYQGFQKIFASCGPVRQSLESPTINDVPNVSDDDKDNSYYNVPTLEEMGYTETVTTSFRGGESEALRRMTEMVINRPEWTASFEKPNTSPNSLEPSTTVLSPYLKFGCLSAARFYHELANIYGRFKSHSQPPVSLHGQLLWREFFYYSSYVIPNFDKMEGNSHCRQIPWERNNLIVTAWKEGRTGYPFIDAIMTQLRVEGRDNKPVLWPNDSFKCIRMDTSLSTTRCRMFSNPRRPVATLGGDIQGVKVFDLYLLDDDWALNNANWQWLSCSNFFYQVLVNLSRLHYFRCYSPVAFGKKTDPEGAYIRKWIPKLAAYPTKYIYEPWKAPLEVQHRSQCVIGIDYPSPIVNHDEISKINMNKMKLAYEAHSSTKSSSLSTRPADDDSEYAHTHPVDSDEATSSKTRTKKRPISDQSKSHTITKYLKK